MGKISRGILGGFSGSVANVVGSSWKGIAVMKSKPLSVANPRTVGQVGQRTKMTKLVALSKQCISAFIRPIWNKGAVKMSGYNAFIMNNMGAFTTAGVFVETGFNPTPSELPKFTALATEFTNATSIKAIIQANHIPTDCVSGSTIYAFVRNRTTGIVSVATKTYTTGLIEFDITVNQFALDEVADVYVSYKNVNNQLVAKSYLSTVTYSL